MTTQVTTAATTPIACGLVHSRGELALKAAKRLAAPLFAAGVTTKTPNANADNPAAANARLASREGRLRAARR